MEKNLRKSKKIQIYVENLGFITIHHKVCMHITQENWKIFFDILFHTKFLTPFNTYSHTYRKASSVHRKEFNRKHFIYSYVVLSYTRFRYVPIFIVILYSEYVCIRIIKPTRMPSLCSHGCM